MRALMWRFMILIMWSPTSITCYLWARSLVSSAASITGSVKCLAISIISGSQNVIFMPQHFLGLNGMPRRYIDYPEEFELWNQVSSFGAYITLAGVAFFLIMLVEAFIRRRPASPLRRLITNSIRSRALKTLMSISERSLT